MGRETPEEAKGGEVMEAEAGSGCASRGDGDAAQESAMPLEAAQQFLMFLPKLQTGVVGGVELAEELIE